MSQTQTARLIDGSLRLWSDDIDLGAVIAAAGWNIDHLHQRGGIISPQGRRAGRHYAAVEAVSLNIDEDLRAWLIGMADQICDQDDLVAGLLSDQIEGVIWLGMFGDDVQPLPLTDEIILAKLARYHVRVLVENYTDFDGEGRPKRTWLTSRHHRN